MAYYPQLYTNVAVMLWVEPNTQRTIKDFLRNAKETAYLNKVMFGSDQMIWSYAIQKSIGLSEQPHLYYKKYKEDILCNNAATFLKIKE